VLDGDPAPSPKRVWNPLFKFRPISVWPNGWMHQNTTWYRCRPRPRGLCVRWRPSPPPQKGGAPQIFGPCLLWPNGWMDQDATWHKGRPQPRRLSVRWGPMTATYPKGAKPHPVVGPCLLWPNGWMDEDATWYGDHCPAQATLY